MMPLNGEDFTTPVVLCGFNRPQHTREVMRRVASVRPKRLFVVADGPRADRPDEAALCAEVLRDIAALATWPTSISWNVAPRNLGCRERIISGLDWVFDQVPEAIIVEDDCVPDPSFFLFCRALLEHYRQESRVGIIAGSNLVNDGAAFTASYCFSRYPICWGWATWSRTWQLYDRDLDSWPPLRNTDWLDRILGDPLANLRWQAVFDLARAGYDTWDYGFTFSCWLAGLVAIHPSTNLICNIGFGADATHTLVRTALAELPTSAIEMPLTHPPELIPDAAHDARLERLAFSGTREDLFAKVRAQIRAGRA